MILKSIAVSSYSNFNFWNGRINISMVRKFVTNRHFIGYLDYHYTDHYFSKSSARMVDEIQRYRLCPGDVYDVYFSGRPSVLPAIFECS